MTKQKQLQKKYQRVFISGIFNVLHPGHIRLFKFASELGQEVVVGVKSNQSLGGIYSSDEDRLDSLKTISLVDHVVLFDDLFTILNEIKPDIVVKGSEFRNRDNPEQTILRDWNGVLIFSSGESQFSAHNLLNRNGTQAHLKLPKSYIKYLERHKIDKQSLLHKLENLRALNIAVIGDSIIDEYVDCEPIGLSREEPTIVVSPKSRERYFGGAAVVARHTQAFGADVDFYSVRGADEPGGALQQTMKNEGINTFIYQDDSRPTTVKTRFRAENKSLLRLNEFRRHEVSDALQRQFVEDFKERVKEYDLILFSDFNYGFLSKEFIAEIRDIAIRNNIPMVADSQTSSQRGDLSKFTDLLFTSPTEIEARLAANCPGDDIGLAVVIERLALSLNIQNVMITLGPDGALLLDASDAQNPRLDSLTAINKNPVDVSGAGDLVMVCNACCLVNGLDNWQAGLVSMVAAGIHVSRVGNTPIEMQQLQDTIEYLLP